MERVDEIMEQVQVFASLWALVGSRFDHDAMFEKAELKKMIINLMKENK